MKKLVITLAAIAGALAVAWVTFFIFGKFYVADAPDPFRLQPTAEPTRAAPVEDDSPPPELNGTWEVDGGRGGYRVSEVLSGVDNIVAGRTEDVSGILVVAEGILTQGTITIDLSTVETDNPSRDGFFRGHLELADFPNALFTFTSELDISALDDGPISVDILGCVVLHGVTLDQTAHIEAQRKGDQIQVVGSIEIDYTNYNLTAPNLGFAVVEPNAIIEVDILLSADAA